MKKSEFKEFLKAEISEALKPYKTQGIRKSFGDVEGSGVKITKENISIAKYIRGALFGNWEESDVEKQAYVSVNKVLREGLGTSGSFLIPAEITTDIIELLRAKSVIRALGATVYPIKGDTLQIPRVTGGATAYWIADSSVSSDYTASEGSFGDVELVLREVAGVTKVKNTLLEDASPAVDKIVMDDLTKVLGLAEDLAYIQGTGGTQPLGIFRDPDVLTGTLGSGNGGSPNFDDLQNAGYAIENANGSYDSWILNPRAKNTLRQKKDGVGNYLYHIGGASRDLTQREPDNILGYKAGITTQVPNNLTVGSSSDCSYIILGKMEDFAIAQKRGDLIKLEASNVAGDSFLRNQTYFRAIQRVDGAVRNANNFYVMKGVRS